MIIVLDTNVLVSGLLKGNSKPGIIVNLVASGRIRVAFDIRIINEYQLVLLRPKFGFNQREVVALLKQIESEGMVVAPAPLDLVLPDQADKPFIEVAAAVEGSILVTGNRRHFPNDLNTLVTIMNADEFIKKLVL